MNPFNRYSGFVKQVRKLASTQTVLLSFLCAVTLPVGATERAKAAAAGKQVWAVSMDNDLFVPFASSDRDFTGGLAFTFSGAKAINGSRHRNGLLGRLDSLFNHQPESVRTAISSLEFGFYGFTPNNTEDVNPLNNDRPYASLMYLSMSRQYPVQINEKRVSTSLTFGLLGAGVMGDTQNAVHRATGNDAARGWGNQISDGGEITARYQIAWHDDWDSNTFSSRFKSTYFASVGYLTEVGAALSTRQGLISSPDNRFNPELITYGERVNETAATPNRGEERYFWGGISLKARLYNAFLQGQFKDSVHSLEFDEVRPLIVEAWLGYTFTLGREFKASYVLRGQSSELKKGQGDRSHVWGGIVLSRGV